MRVLLLGRLQDVAGWRERSLPGPAMTLLGLKAALALDSAELGAALDGPGVQVAVDKSLVRGDVLLGDAAEVAFMAPMSGG